MKKRSVIAICGVFLAFIALFFVLNAVVPDRAFSQQENRSLQTMPRLEIDTVLSGEFMSDFEAYCSDQFVFRDKWISMKARAELLLGKKENNGVFLCEEQRLIEPYIAPSAQELDARIKAINTLTENTEIPVILGLIPGSAELYWDMLPLGVRNDSQLDVIDYVYDRVNAGTLDIAGALTRHSEEPVFYRTDHHWTALGAYYGYSALCDGAGIPCPELDSYPDRTTVSREFYGTTYSTSGFSWVAPDDMEIFVRQPETVTVQRYEGPEGAVIPLYDESRLSVKDKYSYYLGGNTPRLVISTGKTDCPSILIIRDSYCDSLTPFLLENYSEIHILDLRYYRSSIAAYAEENGVDSILILYSIPNFSTDRNIVLLSR